jgi:hypothetical protein
MPTSVTIDGNRIANVNGKPFFPICARHMPEGGTPLKLAEAGFNAYRWMAFGAELWKSASIPCPDETLYFYAYIYDRAVFKKNPDFKRQLKELVGRIKDHPSFLSYENFNEVAFKWKDIDRKEQARDLAEGTNCLRKWDPDHPIWLAHGVDRTVETLQEYNSCMDIVGCNPYPVHPAGMRQHYGVRPDGRMHDCPDQTLHAVGKYTEKMMKVGQGKKPVWMLIQAMANENWFHPKDHPEENNPQIDESMILYPTYEQMRFMAFDAIISGATGLAFSMHKTLAAGPHWEDIKRVVGELNSLHDVLAAPPMTEPINVSYTDLGYSIWDGVITIARRCGEEVYLIAANTAFDPARAAIHSPILPDRGSVVVEGEDREIAIEKGILSDFFKPYEVHIYRI